MYTRGKRNMNNNWKKRIEGGFIGLCIGILIGISSVCIQYKINPFT